MFEYYCFLLRKSHKSNFNLVVRVLAFVPSASDTCSCVIWDGLCIELQLFFPSVRWG